EALSKCPRESGYGQQRRASRTRCEPVATRAEVEDRLPGGFDQSIRDRFRAEYVWQRLVAGTLPLQRGLLTRSGRCEATRHHRSGPRIDLDCEGITGYGLRQR